MPALPISRSGTRLRHAVLGMVLACQCSARAWADATGADLTTVPLEQLLTMEVFSASRFAQKTSEAPSSVTVITADDIRTFGWHTLADVARSVRGMYVSYDRDYSFLSARGFQRPGDYDSRFLLLLDGHRINDGVYDQAPVGEEFPVELGLIERIEFVPGPGSSVYGSNAFFGVINVITRRGTSTPETRAALEAGQGGWYKASASYAWRGDEGLGLLLGASRYTSAGRDLYYAQFDTPDQNHGLAQGMDYERGNRLFARASYGDLAFSLVLARRLKGIPTASYDQAFNDQRSASNDRQAYLTLTWRTMLGADEEINLHLMTARYDSSGHYITNDANRTDDVDGSRARWWNSDVRLVSTRWHGHKVVAGFDYERDTELRQYTYDISPYFLYQDDRRSSTRSGLYLQDELAFGPDVRLNLGLRHDRSSGQQGVNNPRAALIWQLGPHTTFKAIHGSAFRAPNSFEKYYSFPGPGGQDANPLLAPERISSNELVLVHQLGENARLTATAFHNKLSGLVTLAEDPLDRVTHFDNAGQARVRGVELEYERRWHAGATLRTSYSTASLQEASTGPADLVRASAPAHLFKLNLGLPLASEWRSGFEVQRVGQRHGLRGEVDGFWLANLRLSNTSVVAGAELWLAMTNVFDQAYADPGAPEHRQAAITQDGRTVRVGINYAF